MEEKTFFILDFEGISGYVHGDYITKKMSLSAFLKNKSHYYVPDTKRLYESEARFHGKEVTLKDIHKMIEEGSAIFPINVSTDTDLVKNYLDLGLKVYFMRDKEFRRFKKDYTVEA